MLKNVIDFIIFVWFFTLSIFIEVGVGMQIPHLGSSGLSMNLN
jgi:hypothetical protein